MKLKTGWRSEFSYLVSDLITRLVQMGRDQSFSTTVRSGAEERTFSRARLDVLNFSLFLTTFLTTYIADVNQSKSHKNMTFLVQAGMFLSFQAGRSSETRSSASDLTVLRVSRLQAIIRRIVICVL